MSLIKNEPLVRALASNYEPIDRVLLDIKSLKLIMINVNKISEKIKTLRKIQNLRQSELAEKIGISHRHYQTIESGKADFKISFLVKLSEAMNVPSCYFIYPAEQRLSKVGINCHSEILDILALPLMIVTPEGSVIYQNKSLISLFSKKIETIFDLGLDIKTQSIINTFISSPQRENQVTVNTTIFRNKMEAFPLSIEVSEIKNNQCAQSSGYLFILKQNFLF